MKIIYILFLIFLFVSCNNSGVDEKKILDLYEKILIIRTQEQDTTIANPKVSQLFETYNYSEEQFKNDFYTLASKDEKFANKIDSLRNHIASKVKEK